MFLSLTSNAGKNEDKEYTTSELIGGHKTGCSRELQIILESNAYLPHYFLLNAYFQNVNWYFNPLCFSNAEQGRYYSFEVPDLQFCDILNKALAVIAIACRIANTSKLNTLWNCNMTWSEMV